MARSYGVRVPEPFLTRLREAIASRGIHAVARQLVLSEEATARAASGAVVQRGTVAVVRIGIEHEEPKS